MGNASSGKKKLKSKHAKKRIEKASKLGNLNLSHAGLKTLPSGVLKLERTKIRVLDLSLNKFSCLPAPVLEFVALTQLQLSQNALTELPELVVLKKLKQLDVSSNQLAVLPALPKSLRTLNASHNKLTEIPAHVASVANVDLSANLVAVVSFDGFGEAAQIVTLNLDSNQVEALCSDWSKLGKLKDLTLRHNKLLPSKMVAPSLFRDTCLTLLRVEGNPGKWTQAKLQSLPEFAVFEARRLKRANKAIHGGVSVDKTLCGITAK